MRILSFVIRDLHRLRKFDMHEAAASFLFHASPLIMKGRFVYTTAYVRPGL